MKQKGTEQQEDWYLKNIVPLIGDLLVDSLILQSEAVLRNLWAILWEMRLS